MTFQTLWDKQKIAQTQAQELREWRIAVAGMPLDNAINIATESIAKTWLKKLDQHGLKPPHSPSYDSLCQETIDEIKQVLYTYDLFWGHFGGPVSREGWNLVPDNFGSNFIDPKKTDSYELHFLLRLAWIRGYRACETSATLPF